MLNTSLQRLDRPHRSALDWHSVRSWNYDDRLLHHHSIPLYVPSLHVSTVCSFTLCRQRLCSKLLCCRLYLVCWANVQQPGSWQGLHSTCWTVSRLLRWHFRTLLFRRQYEISVSIRHEINRLLRWLRASFLLSSEEFCRSRTANAFFTAK